MYKLIEHTADIGIEAQADSPAKVFLEMAHGLKSLIFGQSLTETKLDTEITIHAEDPVELLVGWLNEIAYWCETENLVPVEFRIDMLTDTDLQATVSGEPFNPQRHIIERQVKSVTYHQAYLEEVAGGWSARVYVDL